MRPGARCKLAIHHCVSWMLYLSCNLKLIVLVWALTATERNELSLKSSRLVIIHMFWMFCLSWNLDFKLTMIPSKWHSLFQSRSAADRHSRRRCLGHLCGYCYNQPAGFREIGIYALLFNTEQEIREVVDFCVTVVDVNKEYKTIDLCLY